MEVPPGTSLGSGWSRDAGAGEEGAEMSDGMGATVPSGHDRGDVLVAAGPGASFGALATGAEEEGVVVVCDESGCAVVARDERNA